jgi:hypothetical protein
VTAAVFAESSDDDDDDDVVTTEPPKPATPAPARDVPAGRRGFTTASRAEVIGGVLLLVATAFAVQALFDMADYTNAFDNGPWAIDLLAVVLTAALLLPFVAFYIGINVPAVLAGTSIGYLAYQGLADSQYFRGYWGDTKFPSNIVFVAILLGAAWYMFRRGSPVRPSTIDHPPSRYLQIAAAVGTLVTTVLHVKQWVDWEATSAILVVAVAVSVVTLILSVRRSQEATIVLATLAAETSFAYLTYAIAFSDVRSKSLNVAIAAAVLTGAALWRTRRATPVEAD